MLKYKALYCWPYKFKQAKAEKLREQLRPKAFELPPIEPAGKPEIELHMLCGKAQLDMGIWASWSILRFLKNAVLYVHSDGTLTDEDAHLWRKIIPSMILISKEEADDRVMSIVAPIAPSLCRWRHSVKVSEQAIDMQLFGKTDRFLIADSDVLCFADPTELCEALSVRTPVFRWSRDIRSCYSDDIELLNKITGLHLPKALNGGFCVSPRWNKEGFHFLENAIKRLEADGRVDVQHYWSPQTYLAICTTRYTDSRPFSDSYAVTLGPTSDKAVVRHYVGIPAVRPRYFTEGLPRLLTTIEKQLGD
jgi:regulator of extracellular matrix RemA (YlzA/DUF370 family)